MFTSTEPLKAMNKYKSTNGYKKNMIMSNDRKRKKAPDCKNQKTAQRNPVFYSQGRKILFGQP